MTDPTTLPLVSWGDFTYAGAFRIPKDKALNKDETFQPCRGGIAVRRGTDKMFVRGYKKVAGRKRMA